MPSSTVWMRCPPNCPLYFVEILTERDAQLLDDLKHAVESKRLRVAR